MMKFVFPLLIVFLCLSCNKSDVNEVVDLKRQINILKLNIDSLDNEINKISKITPKNIPISKPLELNSIKDLDRVGILYFRFDYDNPFLISAEDNNFTNIIEMHNRNLFSTLELNKHLVKNKWESRWGKFDKSFDRMIKTINKSIRINDLIISLASQRYPRCAGSCTYDIIIFKEQKDRIIPYKIYPSVVGGYIWSGLDSISLKSDTLFVKISGRDVEDIYGSEYYFTFPDGRLFINKTKRFSGYVEYPNEDFRAERIYISYYDSTGNIIKRGFDCKAQYSDGTFRYFKTKSDSITFFKINPESPYSANEIFDTVFVKNRMIQMAGPIRGKTVPIRWRNQLFIVKVQDLNL